MKPLTIIFLSIIPVNLWCQCSFSIVDTTDDSFAPTQINILQDGSILATGGGVNGNDVLSIDPYIGAILFDSCGTQLWRVSKSYHLGESLDSVVENTNTICIYGKTSTPWTLETPFLWEIDKTDGTTVLSQLFYNSPFLDSLYNEFSEPSFTLSGGRALFTPIPRTQNYLLYTFNINSQNPWTRYYKVTPSSIHLIDSVSTHPTNTIPSKDDIYILHSKNDTGTVFVYSFLTDSVFNVLTFAGKHPLTIRKNSNFYYLYYHLTNVIGYQLGIIKTDHNWNILSDQPISSISPTQYEDIFWSDPSLFDYKKTIYKAKDSILYYYKFPSVSSAPGVPNATDTIVEIRKYNSANNTLDTNILIKNDFQIPDSIYVNGVTYFENSKCKIVYAKYVSYTPYGFLHYNGSFFAKIINELPNPPLQYHYSDIYHSNLYPNPTSGVSTIVIDTSFTGPFQFKIINGMGTILFNQNISNHSTIDLNGLPLGMYFYSIFQGNILIESRRFIKL